MVICLLSLSVSTSYAAGQFRVGDRGEEIEEIQVQLVSLGYDVMADGAFGAATVEAVKAFQKSHGIKADGLIGPATYSALLGKDMPEITNSASYLANSIVSLSMNYIGVPYVFGGTSPYGFDCSGYVQYVFAKEKTLCRVQGAFSLSLKSYRLTKFCVRRCNMSCNKNCQENR